MVQRWLSCILVFQLRTLHIECNFNVLMEHKPTLRQHKLLSSSFWIMVLRKSHRKHYLWIWCNVSGTTPVLNQGKTIFDFCKCTWKNCGMDQLLWSHILLKIKMFKNKSASRYKPALQLTNWYMVLSLWHVGPSKGKMSSNCL